MSRVVFWLPFDTHLLIENERVFLFGQFDAF